MKNKEQIPDLDNLLNAIACNYGLFAGTKCEECPFGYSHYDDRGDHGFWCCDEQHFDTDIIFYLKLYQYLIKENEKREI